MAGLLPCWRYVTGAHQQCRPHNGLIMLQREPVSAPNSFYLDLRINQVEFYRHPRLEGDSIGRRALDTFDIVKKIVRNEIVLIPCDGTCYLNVSKAIGVLLEDFGFCLCTRESILGLFEEFWTVNNIGCRDHDERGVELGIDIGLPVRQRSKGFEFISVPVARSDLEKILERSNCGCAICLQEFADEERFQELQCLHLFHWGCIYDWLRKNNTCPLCRLENNNSCRLEITLLFATRSCYGQKCTSSSFFVQVNRSLILY